MYSSPVPVHLVTHPLVQDALVTLRDARTPVDEFRRTARRISVLLAAEALREVPTRDVTVETPLGACARPAAGRRRRRRARPARRSGHAGRRARAGADGARRPPRTAARRDDGRGLAVLREAAIGPVRKFRADDRPHARHRRQRRLRPGPAGRGRGARRPYRLHRGRARKALRWSRPGIPTSTSTRPSSTVRSTPKSSSCRVLAISGTGSTGRWNHEATTHRRTRRPPSPTRPGARRSRTSSRTASSSADTPSTS